VLDEGVQVVHGGVMEEALSAVTRSVMTRSATDQPNNTTEEALAAVTRWATTRSAVTDQSSATIGGDRAEAVGDDTGSAMIA
jgi:hypothetical protein